MLAFLDRLSDYEPSNQAATGTSLPGRMKICTESTQASPCVDASSTDVSQRLEMVSQPFLKLR